MSHSSRYRKELGGARRHKAVERAAGDACGGSLPGAEMLALAARGSPWGAWRTPDAAPPGPLTSMAFGVLKSPPGDSEAATPGNNGSEKSRL